MVARVFLVHNDKHALRTAAAAAKLVDAVVMVVVVVVMSCCCCCCCSSSSEVEGQSVCVYLFVLVGVCVCVCVGGECPVVRRELNTSSVNEWSVYPVESREGNK